MGLLHFESVGQQGDRYQVYLSRVGTLRFDADSVLGWTLYHGLDIAAVLVLAGVFIFLRRRLRDPGALAVERSGDFLALAGLFAVSVTGLFLTVSSLWLEGRFYAALNTLHALTVILGLMYIPFGKLFHIFQRPANLGVTYYKRANAEGPAATCRRCGLADRLDDHLRRADVAPRRLEAADCVTPPARDGVLSHVDGARCRMGVRSPTPKEQSWNAHPASPRRRSPVPSVPSSSPSAARSWGWCPRASA
jgi:hypothetical protein